MRIVCLLFCFLFLQCLHAQKAEKAIEQLYKNYPQEKVVLSFSQPQYLAGETIYFKANVLTGYEPSNISTNLYTEFYDKDKHLLDKQIVPLLKGSGEGSFTLPASMAEDVYHIRAYTYWMLNFDDAFQCIKPVMIYNTASAKSLHPKPVQWTARAFAEGGNLVGEMPANVAVRLYAQGSLPRSWSGKLIENKSKETVADVTVFNSEIGEVRFLPRTDADYLLQLQDNEGHTQEISLPKVITTGVVFHAMNTDNKLNYTLAFKGMPSGGKGYRLIGTINDQLVFAATIAKPSAEISGSINTENFPAGVLHLTLFDDKETPLTERLCFLHQQAIPAVQPTVVTDTLSFAPKALNRWQVAMDSSSWVSYALQINDGAYPLQNDFLSSLYLTSDFTNPIHDAQGYFENVSADKKAALDALLITEKWNRFQWNDILQNHFPAIRYHPDNYLTFVATVQKGNKPQPLREMNLILRSRDSITQFVQVKTDSTGRFSFSNTFFVDTVKVFYQPNKRKFLEGDVKIDFERMNRFYPLQQALPPTAFMLDARSKNDSLPLVIRKAVEQRNTELVLNEKSKMLKEVIIRTKAKNPTEELDKQLSSPLFSSVDATVFDFINEEQPSAQAYSNILEWLQGRVAGLTIQMNNGEIVPRIRNSVASIYLDEMQVDADMLNGLSASNIAMIKVIKGYFVGGIGGGGGGAIAIYTRRGGMQSKNATSTLPTSMMIGYKKIASFPSPDYSQEIYRNTNDQRMILYRNTLLQPNAATSKADIRFYNNDNAKAYRLFITGFTQDGNLIYLDKVIE